MSRQGDTEQQQQQQQQQQQNLSQALSLDYFGAAENDVTSLSSATRERRRSGSDVGSRSRRPLPSSHHSEINSAKASSVPPEPTNLGSKKRTPKKNSRGKIGGRPARRYNARMFLSDAMSPVAEAAKVIENVASKFLKSFFEFINKGNVIGLAVGLVVGSAFSKVCDSMVNDILAPLIAACFNGNSFGQNFFILRESKTKPGVDFLTIEEAEKNGAITLNYGRLISAILSFLLTSLLLFLLLRTYMYCVQPFVSKFFYKPPAHKCPFCKEEIKIDALRCKFCCVDLDEYSDDFNSEEYDDFDSDGNFGDDDENETKPKEFSKSKSAAAEMPAEQVNHNNNFSDSSPDVAKNGCYDAAKTLTHSEQQALLNSFNQQIV